MSTTKTRKPSVFDKQGSQTVTGEELKKLRQGDGETVPMTTLQPIDDKILVKRDEAEGQTPGGIVIPEMAKDKPRQGVVVATGPGLPMTHSCGKQFSNIEQAEANGAAVAVVDPPRVKMQVKVGDKVLIPHYSDTVKVGDEEYAIVRESEVLAIIR